MRRRLLLLPFFLLAACGPDEGSNPPDAGPETGPEICDPAACTPEGTGTLVLGGGIDDPDTGTVLYEALEPGEEVAIVPGFQGGQHIWVVLRATDVQTCYVRPRYTVVAEDGRRVLEGRFGGEFYPLPGEPGTFEFLSYAAFISDPDALHGRPTTLRAEVSDGCGHLIADERQVIPLDPRLPEPTP